MTATNTNNPNLYSNVLHWTACVCVCVFVSQLLGYNTQCRRTHKTHITSPFVAPVKNLLRKTCAPKWHCPYPRPPAFRR